ncbi:MAG: phosphotransferase [Anaerolineae bacterium]|nr:phosphotransferase [Anaerolineae bacterium]
MESEHHHLTALHLVRQNADGQDEPIPLILRRYPSPLVWHTFDAPHRAKREFATLQYLEANGFPVPSPQAHGSDDEGCWLLEGVVRGHNWWRPLGAVDFSAVLPGLVRRQVALMARLHSLEIEELNAPAYNLPTITIPDVLETYRKAAQESGDQAAVTAVRDVKEIMLRVEERPPRLLHGDASLTNLLVDDDDQVVGWLDWDEAVLGDPRWDVAALHASLCGSYAMPQLAARSVVEYGQETVRPVKDIEVWVAALAVFRWVQCAWLKHRIAAEEDIAFPSLDRFVDAYDSHRAWALAMLQEAEVGGSDG